MIAVLLAVAVQVHVTQLSDHVALIQSPRGNMVASYGGDGAVVVGEMDTLSTAAVAETLLVRSVPSRRLVVLAMAGLGSIGQGDAGWDSRGALVIMQEFAVRRMSRLPEGVSRPRSEFSQFFSINMNGEPMHAVHQEPGSYANSDVLVHFEGANVIYLGESFPGDGYPRIDASLGGSVDGLLKALEGWAHPELRGRFVGARGPIASGADVMAFRDMVKVVAAEVGRLKAAGKSADDVVAAHPTAAYDQRWGKGLVTADRFVRDVYQSIK